MSRKRDILFLYCVFSLQQVFQVNCTEQRCFVCSIIKKPSECNSTILCKENESCVSSETITADLELGYHLGCVNKDLCEREFSQAVGRKRNLQHKCCRGDLCNNKTPIEIQTVTTTAPSTAPSCQDADNRCTDFNFVYQACASASEAVKCRKTCKLC